MRIDPEPRPIGEVTFAPESQKRFASLSLDRNPIHMDAVAARRLVAGHRVVHGIHILIAAIERWQQEDDGRIESVSCIFSSPVAVGDTVVFMQIQGPADEYEIEALVGGVPCTRITLATAQRPAPAAPMTDPVKQGPATTQIRLPVTMDLPLDENPEDHVGKQYALEVNDHDLTAEYPNACRHLGARRVAGILALSRFVGMVCPGLHSLFSSLNLDRGTDSELENDLAFTVNAYDPRSRLFDIRYQGGIRGSIRAFLRPSPQEQPSLQEVAAHVRADEFSGTRSLVMGGSRGLGEVTAKILAAGGGDVVITYATGREDAERIRDEINANRSSACELRRIDLAHDSVDILAGDFEVLTAVYFFATPRIYRKKAGTFDPQLFAEFHRMYVEKFYALCAALEDRTGRPVRVFFPSSVFVSERPKGLVEYAMAKAAAEVLIQEINRSFRNVRVLSARLPRLTTDQTATVLKIPKESNVATLLPIVRSMNGTGTEPAA